MRKLRDLQVEMDKAVIKAYGWGDLDLRHGFYETKQGIRFTISEAARREVLARLLKLNHERYEEEVRQGLHDKKGKTVKASSGRGRKSAGSLRSTPLFDGKDQEPDEEEVSDEEGESENVKGRDGQPSSRRLTEEPDEAEHAARPTPIDEIETNAIMAAFRQATRGRGWMDREELLKEVSLGLGYQRLSGKVEEALRGHLRAAIRRGIIETEGANWVRAGAGTMADYGLDELRETFRSVMQKGREYEREEVIQAIAHYLGFARVTDSILEPIKSAINSAIRYGVLGYTGTMIWREE